MAKKKASRADIDDFMDAVYPEFGHLAMAAYSEKTVLNDAAVKIRGLEKQVAELRARLEARLARAKGGEP